MGTLQRTLLKTILLRKNSNQVTMLSRFVAVAICMGLVSAKSAKTDIDSVNAKSWDKPSFCRSECPEFEIIEQNADYEVRRYVTTTWVSTSTDDMSLDDARSRNFDKLFDYISGNNVAGIEIAMTSPVITKVIPGDGPACESSFMTSFFVSPTEVPAPEPKDETVVLVSQESQIVYVKSFSGMASENDFLNAAADLASKLPSSVQYHTDF